MKKIFYPIVISVSIMATSSCNNTTKQPVNVNEVDSTFIEESIGILREKHIASSVTIGDKEYIYQFDFVNDKNLPIVRNPQGDDYYDNKVKLSIQHGEKEIYTRTFTKNDFASVVPEKFLKNSALVGFTYNYTKNDANDALYFIATVGDPDETADMVFSVQIRISPSGEISMEKAENLDTEPINPMTIDPTNDGDI